MARRASRFPLRARIAWHALTRGAGRRPPVEDVRRVLIAHNLLLGDTLMLTGLLARLKDRYPHARLVMTCPPAFLPLYEGRPYGVVTVPFDPRDRHSLDRLRALGPFDLVFCRNVMIYFDTQTKKNILKQLHGTMFRGGWLMLGGVETAFGVEEFFERRTVGNAPVYVAR